MLDVGWSELMVIGVVALLVIGPKDLPDMFRQLGRIMAKFRSMGRDFQRAMDEAAKQTGVADVAKDLKNVTNPASMGMGGLKSAADRFEKWDPIKNAAKPTPVVKPAVPAAATLIPEGAAVPVPAASPGPATQALYEKQAAKAAALRDYNAAVKAIDEGAVAAPPVAVPVSVDVADVEPAKPKPARAPRKKKADPA